VARPALRIPWPLLAATVALALSVARAAYLEHFAGSYTACQGCFLLPALGHDAWLLSGLFALLGLAAFARSRALRVLCAGAAVLLLLAMALDLLLLRLLNQRFYVADLVRFVTEVAADWSVARAQFLSPSGIVYSVLAVLLLVLLAGLLAHQRRSRRAGLALFAGAVGAALFAAGVGASTTLRYVHDQYAWNVIGANLPQGREQAFSDAFVERQRQALAALPRVCESGTATGRSVVLVITESLSAYQSALLGGPDDWLPRLDALARANHYFSHFYANGFTTDGGEIAALTGRLPLDPPGAPWYDLAAFGAGDDTLPGIAHRAGYSAHYFTTADLAFLNSGTWLRQLGFDSVEGNESPFYADLPRGPFGAAADEALFARFEQWLDERRDPRPFVAVLLTVSSHPPFLHPQTGKLDAEGTFRYVDAQLAAFHDRLAARGFLRRGVLLITGDHRSMTPLSDEEYRRFGERAFARIPLIVAGAIDLPKVVDAPFQQTDLPASLAGMLGVEYCRGPFTGAFLRADPVPARYVVHSRGDDRNRVDVYFDERVASYLENGDASAWIGAVEPPDAAAVAAWINAQRLDNRVPPRALATARRELK